MRNRFFKLPYDLKLFNILKEAVLIPKTIFNTNGFLESLFKDYLRITFNKIIYNSHE